MSAYENRLRQRARSIGYRLRKLGGKNLYWIEDERGCDITARNGSLRPMTLAEAEEAIKKCKERRRKNAVAAEKI